MIQVIGKICDSATCTRPGCGPEAGCQGHVMREQAPDYIREKAEALVAEAARWGVVLTIEQRPLQPLRMGHYETVVAVRRALDSERSKTPNVRSKQEPTA